MALVNAFGAIALEATQQTVKTALDAQLALDTAGVRGIRRDADTSPVADGQSHTLATNAAGRLKVSAWPGAYALNVGTITSATSVVAVDVSRVSNVTAELIGTFTGVNVTFESSLDGTNWKVEQGVRSSGASIESVSGVLATGVTYSWEFSVNAKNYFRFRATAWASGTATVNMGFGAYATEPFVYTPTHSVQQNGVWTTQVGNTPNTTPILANPLTPVTAATGDTGAKTANFNGATQTNPTAKGAHIAFNIGAVTGTTPTLVAKIQGSADGGTLWYDIPGATTATLTATGLYALQVYPGITPVAAVATGNTQGSIAQTLPRNWRVVYTIAGTTPSFTLTAVNVTYLI